MNGLSRSMKKMNSLFDISGTVALVTGGGTGLGAAMAIGLAEAGADIALVVNRHTGSEVQERITGLGRRVVEVQADLTSTSSTQAIKRVVDEVQSSLGAIDILVNNAGIIRRAPALDFTEQDWDEVMMLNAKTVFFLSQAVAREMVQRKRGKIINIASLLSFSGGITVPSYAASKGAVAQLTKALANEWAQHGVNVNAIAPGYMITDNTEQIRASPERMKSIADRLPAGRWGEPDDLKGAVIFLASRASDYVNGHILTVDGGWMAR
jgi:2-deoxy-D-gluconate 3-dehydrogenase